MTLPPLGRLGQRPYGRHWLSFAQLQVLRKLRAGPSTGEPLERRTLWALTRKGLARAIHSTAPPWLVAFELTAEGARACLALGLRSPRAA